MKSIFALDTVYVMEGLKCAYNAIKIYEVYTSYDGNPLEIAN